MCNSRFESRKYSLVVLNLVDNPDVDGCALELSDNPETLVNEFLVEKYKWNMCLTRFKNINYTYVQLQFVVVDDVYQHALGRSENIRSIDS